jgi:hypothetical protein
MAPTDHGMFFDAAAVPGQRKSKGRQHQHHRPKVVTHG